MWTIVLPTMWRGVELQRMLPLLDEAPNIQEIIIIDNDRSHLPAWMNRQWSRVRCLNPGRNVGVNPAWNVGVHQSQTDLVCIASDDVLFDPKIFTFLTSLEGPTAPGYCLRSLSEPTAWEMDVIPPLHPKAKLVPSDNIPYRFGCLMFVAKRMWVPIPASLKIYFGDYFTWESQVVRGFKPHHVEGFAFSTRDTTTSSAFQETISQEIVVWLDEIKPNLGNMNLFWSQEEGRRKELEMTEFDRLITGKDR